MSALCKVDIDALGQEYSVKVTSGLLITTLSLAQRVPGAVVLYRQDLLIQFYELAQLDGVQTDRQQHRVSRNVVTTFPGCAVENGCANVFQDPLA